jgi:hypothetical protein
MLKITRFAAALALVAGVAIPAIGQAHGFDGAPHFRAAAHDWGRRHDDRGWDRREHDRDHRDHGGHWGHW